MEMKVKTCWILLLFLAGIASGERDDDLLAVESGDVDVATNETTAGQQGFGVKLQKSADEGRRRRVDMSSAQSGHGKGKKEGSGSREDDDEEKTLAQQVADGKYGLIQNEIFANGSNRPGVLSYLSNEEVPRDTKDNFGGLDKDEIWLAEDHILVLRGGRFGEGRENESWPPIDDYRAPPRQVKLPNNPRIPPPFPVQLTDGGPLEFVKGRTETSTNQFPFPVNGSLPALPYGLVPPGQYVKNQSLLPPWPPIPPFLANLPPGATIVSPPSNATDFDEDDPSIYYPPKYDFYYPVSNNSPVPPGPLVPGIVLPPPPDFFAPFDNNTISDKNETDVSINTIAGAPPFVGPKYLPVDERQSTKLRVVNGRNFKRPHSSDLPEQLPRTPTAEEPKKLSVARVNTDRKDDSVKGFKVSKEGRGKFNAPILILTKGDKTVYHALPTTSPKPNHITVPTSLSKDIYIVTTPEGDSKTKNKKAEKPRKTISYDTISPELHPLRSLIRPNVSVSYTGKYGHLPASTPATSPETKQKPSHLNIGHYITKAPEITHNAITSTPDVNVTPVPIVKKIRVRPIIPDISNPTPSKATFYFYEEQTKKEDPTEAAISKPESNNEITQYFSTPPPTSQTPVRQFLEETFKPSIELQSYDPRVEGRVQPYHDKAKIKNYPKPIPEPQYPAELPPVVFPSPKIKALEIQNSGSTGLQKVTFQKVSLRPTPKPYFPPEAYSSPRPATVQRVTPTFARPSPLPEVRDSPFVPSSFYATARPEHVHFTAQEQTLVDDITKNYFTIFGQKINSASTTPLSPVKPKKVKTPASANGGKKVPQDLPVTTTPIPTTTTTTTTTTTNKTNVEHSTIPASHFEQYLKEITGEDQRDFIITGIQGKVKNGKSFLSLSPVPGLFPPQLYTPGSIPIQPFRVEPPVRQYPPGYSTTLTPVVDIQINPHYVQRLPPQKPRVHQKLPHNFGQYLQEITGFAGATTVSPPKILVTPAGGLHLRRPSDRPERGTERPVSLESDILVNFKPPLPSVNAEAEGLDPSGGGLPHGSNIKIVASPDLTKEQNVILQPLPVPPKASPYDSARHFFQNLPNSGYFSPSHQSAGNSFVSYNLPGNGGHFYFLTPQILERNSRGESRATSRGSRNHKGQAPPGRVKQRPNDYRRNYSTDLGVALTNGYSNHDYSRRRRKKS